MKDRLQRRRNRQGSLMTCVLACLVVVASLLAWIAKDAIAARRETRIRLQMHQTDRLLDAGILRATIRSSQDPAYEGETWQPQLLFNGQDARALVSIERLSDQFKVTARIGNEPHITTQSILYSASKIQ